MDNQSQKNEPPVTEERFVEHSAQDSFRGAGDSRSIAASQFVSKAELFQHAEQFTREHGLAEYLEIFKKGALVAQSPAEFENIIELDGEDRAALRNEVSRKWHQPKSLWFTIMVCSIGAAVQGWDQTGSNGANLSFPAEFGIASNDPRDKWIVGLVNAMPTITMTLLGCWCSEPLNNLLGRRGTIFVAGCFSLCSVLGSAFTRNWQQLLACRILLGIGMGIKSSTTSVFAAESAPAAIRGALAMTWQLYVAFGIFLGLSANLAVLKAGTITWRLQLGSAFIPAVPLLACVMLCPESPRWYIKKGRYANAFHALCKLRHTKLQAARDLFSMSTQFEEEMRLIHDNGNALRRFGQLFTIPRLRRANVAAGVVMIAQQMCGINIIAFYSSTIFVEAGVSNDQALWASWGFGLVQFIFALPALKTIDTFGRRSLLLFTFPHMAWTLLGAGLCFLIPAVGVQRLGPLALFIFLFAVFYAPGEGPVAYTYGAEVFPLSHREIGMAWAVAINAGGSAILSLTFPYMLSAFTPLGAFGFYCGLNVLALILIFFLVPETKRLTLEELDIVFDVSTRKFIKYQISDALPYFVNRWILLRRDAKLRPLYDLPQDHRTESYQDPKSADK